MGEEKNGKNEIERLLNKRTHTPCDELALTTAISGFAAALASALDEEELGMAIVMLSQLRDSLATIAFQRAFFEKRSRRARERSDPAAGGEAECADN